MTREDQMLASFSTQFTRELLQADGWRDLGTDVAMSAAVYAIMHMLKEKGLAVDKFVESCLKSNIQ